MKTLIATFLVILLTGCVFKIGEITFYKQVVVKPAAEKAPNKEPQ